MAEVLNFTSGNNTLSNKYLEKIGAGNIKLDLTEDLTGVTISGTEGQFTSTGHSLVVDDRIKVSGPFTGQGQNGKGFIGSYINPTIYKVSAVTDDTFTLVTDNNNQNINTLIGNTTGLSFERAFVEPLAGDIYKVTDPALAAAITAANYYTGVTSATTYEMKSNSSPIEE